MLETLALGRLSQEGYRFKTKLGYIGKVCLKKTQGLVWGSVAECFLTSEALLSSHRKQRRKIKMNGLAIWWRWQTGRSCVALILQAEMGAEASEAGKESSDGAWQRGSLGVSPS